MACGRWHEHALAGAGPLIAEVVRYVNARHWFALEVQEERRGAVSLEQERRQADIRPAVIGPCSGDIGSLSLEEKFSIAFRKVPDHLEEGFRDSFRNLISPAAIGFTVATTVAIAGLSVASGGTAVPVIIAIGYALVGWAIFNAVGDLIDTFLLVHNATDERDLDRAATKLASAAAELTVGVLITLLTRGAGRLGVGGKSRVRANQTNEFETVPPSREGVQVAVDTEGQVYKLTEKNTSDDRPIFETQSGGSTAHTVLNDIPSGNGVISQPNLNENIPISTAINNRVRLVDADKLSPDVIDTFKSGSYVTVETTNNVTLYRKFGGGTNQAKIDGGFASTTQNAGREETAVYPSWNSMRFEAEIEVPPGQKLNIGRVAEQPVNSESPKYRGNADQILLPRNYPTEWIRNVRDGQTGRVYTIDEFRAEFPDQFRSGQ
ncbi:hypothetical protein [Aestuariispira ectoiniformans]|uniref:hypothetical protein n=1 Tax=Aestuariispira ectoiniformans TaxID=2775080 RepID=UPI00223B1EEE|nr:hypothetical protein [Aestuariispira ectoiniformans]